MLQVFRRALRGRRGDDAGFTMIVVMGYGMVLVVAMGLLGGYALHSMKGARHEQDYYRAIEAAQAGVDELISVFNVSSAAAAPTPGWSGWRSASGSKDAAGAACSATAPAATCPQYNYKVEADPTSSRAGAMVIRAVGRSRDVSRAVKVSVAPRSFGDYLYYSGIEALDPSDDLVPGLAEAVLTNHRTGCATRNWTTTPRPASCNEPQFRTGDVLTGSRVHSDDAFVLNGTPKIDARMTTALPSCAAKTSDADCYHVRVGATAAPTGTALSGSGITYDPSFTLPVTASALSTIKGGAGICVYTGPTRIEFHDNEMWVWSPQTPTSRVSNGGSINCGGGVTGGIVGSITATAGGVLGILGPVLDLTGLPMNDKRVVSPIPAGIYVQPVSPGSESNALACPLKQLLGQSTGTLDVSLSGGCNDGTLLISGTLDGRVTAGADNDIVIVDQLKYKSTSPDPAVGDLLGLIARNNVEVYNPLQCTLALTTGCLSGGLISGLTNVADFLLGKGDFEIDAAIVALNGRFGVQLSNLLPGGGVVPGLFTQAPPKLKLRGSVAMKYAGYVGGPLSLNVLGTGNIDLNLLPTGFSKDYQYDGRLRTQLPLFFPSPSNPPYERNAFAETSVPSGL